MRFINKRFLSTGIYIIICFVCFNFFTSANNIVYVGNWADCTQPFSEGSGSRFSPYKITTAGNLAYIAKQVNSGCNFKNKYFILCNDIDLSGKEWLSIGGSSGKTDDCKFCGNFDGNNKTIFSMKIDKRNQSGQGLFGCIESAKIKNFKMENCSINGKADVGCVVGCAHLSNISDCFVSKSIINGQQSTGSIVGRSNKSDISKSASNATVSGIYHTGGICGSISAASNIDQCYFTGEVRGVSCTAGLSGYSTGTVSNCFSKAKIIVIESRMEVCAGGLIGCNSGKLKNSFSASSITFEPGLDLKTSCIGLLVGHNKGSLNKIYHSIKMDNPQNLVPVSKGIDSGDNAKMKLTDENIQCLMKSNKLFGFIGPNLWTIDSKKNEGYPYLINVPLLN